MEYPSHATDGLSNSDFVEAWQQSSNAVVPEIGTVGRFFESLIKMFSMLLDQLKGDSMLSLDDRASLKNSFDILRLWGHGFDASRGELDKLLEHSTESKDLTISLLISIGDIVSEIPRSLSMTQELKQIIVRNSGYLSTLDEAKYALSSEYEMDDSSSDTDLPNSDQALNQTRENLKDLRTYLDCLNDLNTVIETAIVDRDQDGQVKVFAERVGYHFYADLITARFPSVNSALARHLGQANWARYQRIHKQHTEGNLVDLVQEKAVSLLSGTKFHDSALGSSRPNKTLYASTLVSFGTTSAGGSHSKLPPLSEEAKKGKAFICDGCGKPVRIQSTREWKEHIFQDLVPYNCVFSRCGYGPIPFPDQQAWIDHLGSNHGLQPEWNSRQCSFCEDAIGPGRFLITTHLARHLEEIALAAIPRGTDSKVNSEIGSNDSDVDVAELSDSISDNLSLGSTETRYTGQVDAISRPDINIEFAPLRRQVSFEPRKLNGPDSALSPFDRSKFSISILLSNHLY
ncbi:hypothetical protein K432DRAFT_311161 [Lepidopterella palustris CBS 459.81]|uniref:Oxidoreductase acuF-like C2H2 type zinc-finger domain-containing protein n=1 Tax=Lepidopterella palustris CBS 459.81 TaxID=1314670 RepID=A0A8E2DYU9_9PEZI|nr:hypothetical protein K432DRAFT_311161 [Lepidopterella palustris CBS 459.81]